MRNHRASFELDVDSRIQIFSVNEKHAVAATVPGQLAVLDLECDHDAHADCPHKRRIDVGMGWDACCYDNTLVTAGHDGVVRTWSLETGTHLRDLAGHPGPVVCLAMASSCTFVSGGDDATIRLWDPASASASEACQRVFTGHSGMILCMIVQGSLLVSGAADSTARIWSLTDGKCLHSLAHPSDVVALGLKEDGTMLATSDMDGLIKIWTTSDGTCIATCEGHTRIGRDIRWVSGNLVTTSADGTVRTWNGQDGSLIHVLNAHKKTVTGFVYTDDYLITGGLDGRLKVWSRGENKFLCELREKASCIERVFGTRTLLVGGFHVSDHRFLIQTFELPELLDSPAPRESRI